MVPNGWNQLKGKEITSKITKGSSPKWQGFDYQKEGTLFVTSENVRDGFLDISSPKYLPLEFNQKLKNSQLEKGDILINIVGASIGRSCQFDIENQSANINQAVCLFRTNELVKSEFIYQFLQHSTTVNKLLGTQSESARPNLSLSDMRDFVFSIPPLPEQRKIAKILSTWDKAISTTERLIDNSKQQKKALMQQLLTGKKRLLDDSGKPFEGEWEDLYLHDVAKIIVSPVDKKIVDGEIPVELCNYTDVYYNTRITNSIEFMKATAKKSEIDKYTLQVNDVIITKDSETPGDIAVPALVSEDLGGTVCGYHLAIVRPNSQLVEGAYLNYLFSMQKTRYYFFTLATGATRFGLSIGGINKAHFTLPPLEEQRRIAAVLTNSDREVELLEQQLADLKQEKKALMQQLLTGKRRVKVDEEAMA
ncbi:MULTISPECIES: restriction endonuclease subunit S [Alteromonas]|jgi:type I restriction enzyme S subunit|uniref:restriction endonuclease subunit S n=1 Tax=Alteromonas TaxID=226 RepID=UPI00069AD8A7|nr:MULTISPECIES: restriction endonuclease subunit S [Alteromonas]|tara:strand:+ start:3858 stop:5120 length:1263 start_codon:yes stop_codon:yes gene_type:complete